jgi:hypothetical protein
LFSARWKLKYSGAGADESIFRGVVTLDSDSKIIQGGNSRRDVHIHNGEILKPVTTMAGTLTEKKVGDFEMDLLQEPSDEEKL